MEQRKAAARRKLFAPANDCNDFANHVLHPNWRVILWNAISAHNQLCRRVSPDPMHDPTIVLSDGHNITDIYVRSSRTLNS